VCPFVAVRWASFPSPFLDAYPPQKEAPLGVVPLHNTRLRLLRNLLGNSYLNPPLFSFLMTGPPKTYHLLTPSPLDQLMLTWEPCFEISPASLKLAVALTFQANILKAFPTRASVTLFSSDFSQRARPPLQSPSLHFACFPEYGTRLKFFSLGPSDSFLLILRPRFRLPLFDR